MNKADIVSKAFSMPLAAPAYPPGPYRFVNREFFVISYETDLDALRAVVPEPLEVKDPIVNYEFIRMPDSNGFGCYTETGQVIPVTFQGEAGSYVHAMYLDDMSPIAAGRELWGFPKKMATVSLDVCTETLVGRLSYDGVEVVVGTMGYKYFPMDQQKCAKALAAPGFLLKIMPHVDGSLRICELVRYRLQDIGVKSAWSGPGGLQFFSHALAPVMDLPIKKILSASHVLTDLTLPYGEVVHDYLV